MALTVPIGPELPRAKKIIKAFAVPGYLPELDCSRGEESGSGDDRVPVLLTLGGILPDDQGGGAVLWPEHRDGQSAGTWVPRR